MKLFAGAAPDLGNIFERDSGFEEDCAGDLMLSWMCWRSSRSRGARAKVQLEKEKGGGAMADTESLRVGFPQIKCMPCLIKCMNILGM